MAEGGIEVKPEQEYLLQSIREWFSLLRRELGHKEAK